MAWKLMLASAVAMAARSAPYAVAKPAGKSFVAHASDLLPLKPTPINPDWIVSGNPQARTAEHSRGHDEASLTAIWDCTAGEFRWRFGWDETVMILEGEVHITAEDGTERTLRAGDVAFFAGGTWASWRVDNYVRKVAFLRKPFPKPLAIAYRLRNMLRNNGSQGIAA
ncbi:cupin domain-containing protein [Rhizobium ruizarguesonis]|nr:cupin domain-containing protein [Rhizobium ruizarguesonis]